MSKHRLDDLLADGTIDKLLVECRTDREMSSRLGVTIDALQKWRGRRGLDAGYRKIDKSIEYSISGIRIEYADTQIRNDFADEERTQPSIQIEAPRTWHASDFRNPEALPYNDTPEHVSRKLTREECPDGTLILWTSDIHVPIHNEPVVRLMIDCAERTGVSRVVVGGDGLDFNCLSMHKKESARTVKHATILEEVEPGRWLMDWFATKRSTWILGNHEDRLKRFIDENPAFHGSVAGNFAQVVNLPSGIEVLPQGSEVRLGNLSMRHLDAEFKNGTGGKYPAQRLLEMLPDQSTIGGHLHRISQARRTTRDEEGIKRTRCAWVMGHLSHEHMHYNYVSTTPNWQTGFGLVRVWWEDDRPRWSVYQIEVLFDRYNRPYFEFGGWLYR